MKQKLALCLFMVLGLLPAQAQLDLSLRLAHSRYLPYEPVVARVKLTNNSGVPMVITPDEAAQRIGFEVHKTPLAPVRTLQPVELREVLSVPADESVSVEVELSSFYDLTDTGPYAVRLYVKWDDEVFWSGKQYLDVVPGYKLDQLSTRPFGVGASKIRFTLYSLHRDVGDHLFARIDDRDERLCLGVYDLGRLLRVKPPELEVAPDGEVHVLHQSGPTSFVHSVFSGDGHPLSQEVHSTAAIAHLVEAPGGGLTVKAPELAPPVFEMGAPSLREMRREAGKTAPKP